MPEQKTIELGYLNIRDYYSVLKKTKAGRRDTGMIIHKNDVNRLDRRKYKTFMLIDYLKQMQNPKFRWHLKFTFTLFPLTKKD
jgi:hypothetical protein